MFIADEDIVTGASWHLERLLRAWDRVAKERARRGLGASPRQATVQSDNTVAAMKNSETARTFAGLAIALV